MDLEGISPFQTTSGDLAAHHPTLQRMLWKAISWQMVGEAHGHLSFHGKMVCTPHSHAGRKPLLGLLGTQQLESPAWILPAAG
jgi:endonuclease III